MSSDFAMRRVGSGLLTPKTLSVVVQRVTQVTALRSGAGNLRLWTESGGIGQLMFATDGLLREPAWIKKSELFIIMHRV